MKMDPKQRVTKTDRMKEAVNTKMLAAFLLFDAVSQVGTQVRRNKMERINDLLRVEGIMSQGFGLSPKIVMRDQRLTIEAKAIYSYIVSFAGGGNQSFPGRDMMVEELGISVKRYYKHLQLLIDCDYLRIEREKGENGMFGRNIYTIVANPESDYTVSDVPKDSSDTNDEMLQSNNANSGGTVKLVPKRRKQIAKKENSLRLQLGIDELSAADPASQKDLELILSAAMDMAASKEIKVAGAVKSREAVMDILAQLTADHVRVILKTLQDNREKIKNVRSYLQACIVNSIYENVSDITRSMEEAEKRQTAVKQEVAKADEKKRIFEAYPELRSLDQEAADITMKICRLTFTGDKSEKEQLIQKRKSIDLQIEAFCCANQIDAALIL